MTNRFRFPQYAYLNHSVHWQVNVSWLRYVESVEQPSWRTLIFFLSFSEKLEKWQILWTRILAIRISQNELQSCIIWHGVGLKFSWCWWWSAGSREGYRNVHPLDELNIFWRATEPQNHRLWMTNFDVLTICQYLSICPGHKWHTPFKKSWICTCGGE